MIYCELQQVFKPMRETRSPVLFLHGFPDSPQMWADYVAAAEAGAAWANGRSLYTFAFPNRQTRPSPIPSWRELRRGILDDELTTAVAELATISPTGKIIPVAHDLGATHIWRYVRERGGGMVIDKLVALSVGSSFRYDIWEHGLNAFTWMYQMPYIVPYNLRLPTLRKLLTYLLVHVAGYRSERSEDIWRDTYHYWDGWLWPLRLPFYLLGAAYRPTFLNFDFPVLYMRSGWDRIASTRAFEREIAMRPDCRLVILEAATHWFPEQQSDVVLAELETFLT